MSAYGLEIDGSIGQVQISTSDNLSLMTAVQGPVAVNTSTEVGTDGFDVVFARPSSTSGNSILYNAVNLFSSLLTGAPTNVVKFKPSVAANVIRYRPQNNGSLGSTVSLGNTQGNYGLQVFDSAGGTIYDSRKVTAGLDVVARVQKGTISNGDVIYTIPSGESLSDYYLCYYPAIRIVFNVGIANANVIHNAGRFDYSNRQIKYYSTIVNASTSPPTGYPSTSDMLVIKLKGG